MASNKLRDNNPNIADLSDPNRPTKLSEQFSEMYDNEWTDAFDELEKLLGGKGEKEIISYLRDFILLKRIMRTNHRMETCLQIAKQFKGSKSGARKY
ncbi:hypothetical protein CHS0354_018691 [Potamilus streckersoni]|uniref:Uncharacterized protein n=1 Tax=Potamilus streckersoni TaxID=2493646 RepID=A0AAE0VYG2_9BIVA|nr:hypothetical protein CHS0354_018691 [Potamilus streckersoni]